MRMSVRAGRRPARLCPRILRPRTSQRRAPPMSSQTVPIGRSPHRDLGPAAYEARGGNQGRMMAEDAVADVVAALPLPT